MIKKRFGLTGILVALLVFATVAGAGWYVWDQNQDEEPKTTIVENNEQPVNEEEENKETIGTVITTGDSEFGTMLFDDNGQAIYIWELEESSQAECYGSCAEAWPPVLTEGTPQVAGDVRDELIGTTERTDGSTQVTYNGHPLYYYAHEEAGEVKCHNISTHGGLWWVIQPNGVRAS